jgi:hypothetical protein
VEAEIIIKIKSTPQGEQLQIDVKPIDLYVDQVVMYLERSVHFYHQKIMARELATTLQELKQIEKGMNQYGGRIIH